MKQRRFSKNETFDLSFFLFLFFPLKKLKRRRFITHVNQTDRLLITLPT